MNSDQDVQKSTIDLRVLCNALGFATVAVQGDAGLKEGALRARGLARLIEEYCRASVPESFGDEIAQSKLAVAERMAAVIVASSSKGQGECQPHDLNDHGFTPEEIERHWVMANALARVRLNINEA
jgi:hypothetical protein